MNTSHQSIRRLARGAFALAVLTMIVLGPCRADAQTAWPAGQISYQGFLTDGNGVPLATNAPKNYDVTFRLYNKSTPDATLLWAELQTVTVDRGYFSVLLGQGSPVSGVAWTNNLAPLFTGPTASDRYVGITVSGLGSSDTEIQPRLRLLASPYAFLAANALLASNAVTLVGTNGSTIITTVGNSVGINKTPGTTNALGYPGDLSVNGITYLNGSAGILGSKHAGIRARRDQANRCGKDWLRRLHRQLAGHRGRGNHGGQPEDHHVCGGRSHDDRGAHHGRQRGGAEA